MSPLAELWRRPNLHTQNKLNDLASESNKETSYHDVLFNMPPIMSSRHPYCSSDSLWANPTAGGPCGLVTSCVVTHDWPNREALRAERREPLGRGTAWGGGGGLEARPSGCGDMNHIPLVLTLPSPWQARGGMILWREFDLIEEAQQLHTGESVATGEGRAFWTIASEKSTNVRDLKK